MAFTKKQARSLAKAWRARGMPVPAKIRRKLRNPGTAEGARKARRKRSSKIRKKRASARKYYTKRKSLRGYKITARRKAGRRKANKRWAKSVRMYRPTGRKGTIAFRKPVGHGKFKLMATNPRRRRRRSRRRNPATKAVRRTLSVSNWTEGLTRLPQNVPAIFKGKMVPKILSAAGGAVGGIVLGNTVGSRLMAMLPLPSNRWIVGGVNAAMTYSGGYLIGTMLLKGENKKAFITGAAIAAIANLVMPGVVQRSLMAIPGVNMLVAQLPGINGLLGAYVSAPGYQGVGTYVNAPGYQGVGMLPSDMVAGIGYDDALAGNLGTYVEAPSYQGVGMFGSSHLDQ